MTTETNGNTYTAFVGARQIAAGTLRDVLPTLKQKFDVDNAVMVLVFEDETGRQVEFDLRGSLEEVLDRESPDRPKGPGRPRLGVASREVSLLHRHWHWLEQQPNGISAALRRLVEQAMKAEPGKERARLRRAAVSRFLTAMAGNRPNYEEASRALFAGDTSRFEALIRRWPKDIREYALVGARQASRAEGRATG